MTPSSSTIEIETVFSTNTMRVLRNMATKVQQAQIRYPTEGPELEALSTREAIDDFISRFDKNYIEMARSYALAMTYVASPGVRLWPDNPREDCLSLSGSLHGMQFGIIFSDKGDGTGTWSFHS